MNHLQIIYKLELGERSNDDNKKKVAFMLSHMKEGAWEEAYLTDNSDSSRVIRKMEKLATFLKSAANQPCFHHVPHFFSLSLNNKPR